MLEQFVGVVGLILLGLILFFSARSYTREDFDAEIERFAAGLRGIAFWAVLVGLLVIAPWLLFAPPDWPVLRDEVSVDCASWSLDSSSAFRAYKDGRFYVDPDEWEMLWIEQRIDFARRIWFCEPESPMSVRVVDGKSGELLAQYNPILGGYDSE